MTRMLGKARSDHDLTWCCRGHDPGIKQGRRPGPKKIGRRGQRAREQRAWQREARDENVPEQG